MAKAKDEDEDAPTVKGDSPMLYFAQKYERYQDLPHYTGNKFKDELMENA